MAKRTSPNAFISFFLTFLMFPQNPSPWGKPWSRRSEWESVQRAQGSKPKAFITKPDHCRSGYKSRQKRKLSRENYRQAFGIPEDYLDQEGASHSAEDCLHWV